MSKKKKYERKYCAGMKCPHCGEGYLRSGIKEVDGLICSSCDSTYVKYDWWETLTKYEHGYLFEEIKERAPKEDSEILAKWMFGQTCPVIDGKSGIYSWDLERWLEQGKKTEQGADWD